MYAASNIDTHLEASSQSETSKKPKGSILSFGELLLRICPDEEGEWTNSNILPFFIGGAEANVATALALWNIPSAYFSALPDNLLARHLVAYLESKNIDTSRILYQGERIGLFYLPQGKDMKNAAVIYDRKYSSFDQLKPATIDWDKVFNGISGLHITAISPALNQQVADVCLEAVSIASKKEITVSLDLNYRAQLWKYGKAPDEILPEIASHADLIMGNIWAVEKMLGIPVQKDISKESSRSDYIQAARFCSQEVLRRFPQTKLAALTFRMSGLQNRMNYYATLYSEESDLLVSREYETDAKIDQVGSGDCFMAGLIYGVYSGLSLKNSLEFATAAAFKKLFVQADATTTSIEQINQFILAQ